MYGYYKLEVRQVTDTIATDGIIKIYRRQAEANDGNEQYICAPDIFCTPDD